MASAEGPEAVIHRFAALLETAGVPYMLTGSFASGYHGAPRASQDIDIVIAPSPRSLDSFLSLLPDDRYYVSRDAAVDAYRRQSLFNVVDFASGWKVDFICRKTRPFSVTEFERRSPRDFGGRRVFLASPEDVLVAKLEWAKLAESDRQIEDAAGIVRVQGEGLDHAYVARWVAELDLERQWERALTLAGSHRS
jgi:hypothetical protein